MDRRTLLKSLVAAPAVVHAENIMPIWVPRREIITPMDYEEGMFTPSISDALGIYKQAEGRYTRVGDMVTFTMSGTISLEDFHALTR